MEREVTDKAWIRRWNMSVVVLIEFLGDKVRVSVDGSERILSRAFWRTLPISVN